MLVEICILVELERKLGIGCFISSYLAVSESDYWIGRGCTQIGPAGVFEVVIHYMKLDIQDMIELSPLECYLFRILV